MRDPFPLKQLAMVRVVDELKRLSVHSDPNVSVHKERRGQLDWKAIGENDLTHSKISNDAAKWFGMESAEEPCVLEEKKPHEQRDVESERKQA